MASESFSLSNFAEWTPTTMNCRNKTYIKIYFLILFAGGYDINPLLMSQMLSGQLNYFSYRRIFNKQDKYTKIWRSCTKVPSDRYDNIL
jgi:hypothetical protein